MKNRRKNNRVNRNSGFTMVETLATVAIIVILLAVSAVAVVRYIDYLKLTELDNAAREIYMAAQNRAVLLAGNQQLSDMVYVKDNEGNQVDGCGTPVTLNDGKYHGEGTEVVSLLATVGVGDNVFYVHVTDFWDKENNKYMENYELLDTGNIDPTLLEKGDFYIVYDLVSGSVTDVIYAERSKGEYLLPKVTEESGFQNNYENWWIKDHSERVKKSLLVGWYNGKAAESSAQPVSPDGQPVLLVDIENGEELTVTVTVYYGIEGIDDAVKEAVVKAINAGKLEVRLGRDSDDVDPTTGLNLSKLSEPWLREEKPYNSVTVGDGSYRCTWVLDSLRDSTKSAEVAEAIMFKNIYNYSNGASVANANKVTPGENFRVTAIIPKDTANVLRERYAYDVNNSLFAEDSEPENGIARVACLRHLQNLDKDGDYESGVMDSINSAYQTANIFGYGNEILANDRDIVRIYDQYRFIPINNTALTSYNGYNIDIDSSDNAKLYGYEIRNLKVKTSGSGSTSEAFGLFGQTTLGMNFSNIRLVNTEVDASGISNAYVGALVGQTLGNAKITNCWVYWETGEDESVYTAIDLKEKLGTDEVDDEYHYQLIGDIVGGLVGVADGRIEIEKSLAATMISGTTAVGGLVGRMNYSSDSSDVNSIKISYADCYLTGSKQVAGLVGDLYTSTTSVKLENCYSAGFIQIDTDDTDTADGFKAAGLCLGKGKTTTVNVYTAMRYINEDLQSISDSVFTKYTGFYYLTENPTKPSGADSFANTYYWGIGENISSGAQSATYKTMTYDDTTEGTDSDFAVAMNGDIEGNSSSYFSWHPATHAYNLRKDLVLTIYDFPGLAGLDHYGDWGEKFRDASLVYYEHYGNRPNTTDVEWGISGGNITNLLSGTNASQEENLEVLSDGYAVALLEDTLEGVEELTISYTYLIDDKIETGEFPAYSKDWKVKKTEWNDPEIKGTQTIYLIPLPDELVYNSNVQDSFYHYIKIEISSFASGEYFFNPHFAETVQPYSGTPDPTEWDDVKEEANKLVDNLVEVSIRTPRHLYDLSLFDKYYNNSKQYAFHQYLNLDYSVYKWSGMYTTDDEKNLIYTTDDENLIFKKTEGNETIASVGTKPYKQKPIGSQTQPFRGSYNGDYHLIKNVIPDVEKIDAGNRYAGLFGNFQGTRLENIVYQMGPDVDMDTVEDKTDADYAPYRLAVERGGIAEGMYIGGLVGFNNGMVDNCAVYGVDVKMTASGIYAYVGGLVGRNEGTITNCSAESNALTVDGSSFAHIYAGGFVGENANNGSISAAYAVGRINGEVKDSEALICGFAGMNSGTISNAYAAADLEPSGGAEAYGFCKDENELLTGENIGYLDKGNYTYRKGSYAANYSKKENNGGKSYTYDELKDFMDSDVMAQPTSANSPQKGTTETQYPFPATVKNKNGAPIHYGLWIKHMALGQMGVFYWEKLQDVTTGDDGVSIATGEGTYHIYALVVDPEPTNSASGKITKQSTLSTAYNDGKAVTEYGYGYYYDFNIGQMDFGAENIQYKENGDTSQNNENARNKALKDLMGDDNNYIFYSWESYHEQSGVGLTPIVSDDPNVGTFTLTQTDKNNNKISVKFIINPHFAASMSVSSILPEGYTFDDGIYGDGNKPGSANNPFQVRSGRQLQNINWKKDDHTNVVLVENEVETSDFPYLNKGGIYWEQTHDLNWTAEGNSSSFTPIAGSVVESTTLYGWFGGIYYGQSYIMKNFNIGYSDELNYIGLFGAVNGAILENIILYSEASGAGTLTITGRTNDNEDLAAYWWYAGGVLAGIAQDSEITGCAVAGYTINDETSYARERSSKVEFTGNRSAWYVTITFNGGEKRGVLYYAINGKIGEKVTTTDITTNQLSSGSYYLYVEDDDAWYYLFNYNGSDNIAQFKYADDKGNIGDSVVNGKITPDDWGWDDEVIKITVYDMGGAIGGLVGMVSGNKELSRCAAVVDINLNGEHSAGGNVAPIRVGGLVGSTTTKVENCYTGGSINYNSSTDNVKYYIGRIIGGVGIELLEPISDVKTSASAEVENCYSYMNIPGGETENGVISAIYNIGGTEIEINTAGLKNNYYLSNAKGPGNVGSAGEGTGIDFQQLLGEDTINGSNIYTLLNGNESRNPYDEVTKSIGDGNLAASGRYTFVPASVPGLQGLDYPFPAILKRGDNYVHYGAWTLYGIERYKATDDNGNTTFNDGEWGGSPVEMNLFIPKEGYQLIDSGLHLEYLKLSDDIKKPGTWKVTSSDVDVVKASFDNVAYTGENNPTTLEWNDGTGIGSTSLYLKAKGVSSVPVTVTVEYTESGTGGKTIELNINVYVTASVNLEPTKLSMFLNDTIEVKLVPDGIEEGTDYTLELKSESIKSTSSYVTPIVKSPDTLVLSTNEGAWGTVYVDVDYKYTLNGLSVEDTKRIEITVLSMPEQLWTINEDEDTYTLKWTMDFSKVNIVNLPEVSIDDNLHEGIDLSESNGSEIVLKTNLEAIQDKDVILIVTAAENAAEGSGEGLEHRLTITVPKPVTSTDVKLKITQNESIEGVENGGWTIDFGEYEVLECLIVEGDSGFTADLLENGTVVLNSNDSSNNWPENVSLDVMLTNSETNLREKITLNIVLPELSAELCDVDYDGDVPIYSWEIDLKGNSTRPEDSMTLEVLEEGYQAKYSEDGKSVIITEVPNKSDSTDGETITGSENEDENMKPITLTVTLTPDGSPTEIYTLTVGLPIPDEPDIDIMELQMFPGDTVTLPNNIFVGENNSSGKVSIKKVTSYNENVVEAGSALSGDGSVELRTTSNAENWEDVYVDVLYTYNIEGKIVIGITRIDVTLFALPQGMWIDTDDNLQWTISFSDALYSNIQIDSNSVSVGESSGVQPAFNENNKEITLTANDDLSSETQLTFTATITGSDYVHSVEIIVPEPVSEGGLNLNIEKTDGGWNIYFGEYEVVGDGTAGEGAARIANETTGNSVLFLDDNGDEVSKTLTVILSKGNLRQKITLQIVLPKLSAALDEGAADTESDSPSWNISLDSYKNLVKSVKLTAGTENEGRFIVTPDTEITPDQDVSSGDENIRIGSYKLKYTGGGEIPQDVKLNIYIVTNAGLTENCTVTIELAKDTNNVNGDDGDNSSSGNSYDGAISEHSDYSDVNAGSANGGVSDGDLYSDGGSNSEDSDKSVTSSAVLDAYLADNQNEDEYSDEEESEEEPTNAAAQPESEQMLE